MLIITSDLFSWNPATQCFAGEASELEAELLRQGRDRLDYRDGQWGFHMRSQRSGQVLWFQRVGEHRDAEGELTHVEFVANLSPAMRIQLMVFND
jgi:hypothetical protein